jgi:flagellar M-ring protein FliF
MALPRTIQELYDVLRAQSPGRLISLAAVAAASMGFLLWIALGSRSVDYRVLYRGLPEEDASRVVEALQADKIAYRLDQGGTTVSVPASQVYDARIRLAGKGLPTGGGVGFEIFDRTGFGVTEFVNRVNYRRALQGELARSIEQLDAVERARVQVAVPERSSFVGHDTKEASASVVVRMRAGEDLTPAQVRGIQWLVASSVEGLKAEAVSVVDHRGRLLTAGDDGAEIGGASGPALVQEARLEDDLTRRVESILERTVGPGRVVARVRAELDWSRSERTEERFDPDSQVARSEQRTTETSTDGSGSASGVPGVTSNAPDAKARSASASSDAAGGSSSAQSSETINYEISKTVNRQVLPAGAIKRLSVAVLVDGKPVAPAPGEKPTADGPATEASFTPWSADELKQFEDLVKQAVGFSAERGDHVSVVTAPFRSFDVEPEEGPGGWIGPRGLELLASVLHYLVLVVLLVVFARLVVRPILAAIQSGAPASLPARAGQLEVQLVGAGAPAPPPAEEKPPVFPPAAVRRDAGAEPPRASGEESVKAIRNWLSQR